MRMDRKKYQNRLQSFLSSKKGQKLVVERETNNKENRATNYFKSQMSSLEVDRKGNTQRKTDFFFFFFFGWGGSGKRSKVQTRLSPY